MRPFQGTSLALLIVSLTLASANDGSNWEQRPVGSDSNVQIPPSYEPCNGIPQYCHLPIDWSVWLGASSSGSASIEKVLTLKGGTWVESEQEASNFPRTQDRGVTSMLDDGIRLLKVDLCARNGEVPHVCFASGNDIGYGTTFEKYVREAFQFMSEHHHQGLILHLNDNPMDSVDIRYVERVLGDVCVEFANKTLGVKHFQTGECPWIFTKKEVAAPLPTVGELVDHDPQMSQWEGDGEHVGVQSRMIVTHSQDFTRPYGYKSQYMSQPFWQSTYESSQAASQLKARLKKMWKRGSAIEVAASLGRSPACVDLDACEQENTVSERDVTNLLLGALSPNQDFSVDTMSQHARIAAITVSFYESRLAQLKELQRSLLKLNEKKLDEIKALHREAARSRTDSYAAHRDEL